MFNSKDTLFGKKEEINARDTKLAGLTRASASTAATATTAARVELPTPAAVTTPVPAIVPVQSGSKLIVGPDIKLKGVEITDCDTLVVEGRVEASMDSRVIQIAEHGVYSGTVCIDVAEIHGRFEGELTARKQLIIHAGGRVSGTIRYGKITIEDGGELSGTISTLPSAGTVDKNSAAHPDIMTPYDPFAGKTSSLAKPATATH